MNAEKMGGDAVRDRLVLRFSHNIIEHLGLKLYQNKPTNVLAELVSNSWDADATHVWVDLRNTDEGSPASIVVADDGSGMSTHDLVKNYLIVGKPKRGIGKAGEVSPQGRPLMGRKGIGKLAPFGVARVVHLLTSQSNRLTWLKFDYQAMINSNDDITSLHEYPPEIIYQDKEIGSVLPDKAEDDRLAVSKFLSNITSGGNGTLILARDLTLRRPINPKILLESLGRRFTVTMARADFIVTVNEDKVDEKDVFPKWDLRIPEAGFANADVKTPAGEKPVRFWAGFVKEASWPSEQAGVGVYAHGKIAQDRPYFFEIKGNEVFSRYLYGVIEADWIDELPDDAISTDRTTIDWSNEAFDGFKKWGAEKTKEWINAYEKHRKAAANRENVDLVDDVAKHNPGLALRQTEKQHLLQLLNDVTPRLSKDAEPKAKFVEATMKAWVHDPARRLIKRLWEQAAKVEPEHFASTVTKLADELVPESLSLAVVFAQRVFALQQLQDRIALGKETDLQALIEEFPWILKNSYERFIARRELKTICEEAEKEGKFEVRHVHTDVTNNASKTKPDFVFLGTPEDRRILVVELKSPSETAAMPEHEQLYSYMSFLTSRFSSSEIEGILVARDFAEVLLKGTLKPANMAYSKWEDLLLRSRRDHMELLAALLAGSHADANDSRVTQICELGGATVRQFLSDMSAKDPELSDIVSKLKPAFDGKKHE